MANASLIKSCTDQSGAAQTCLDLTQFESKWLVDEELHGKFQLKTKEQKTGNVVQPLFTDDATSSFGQTFTSDNELWEVVITKLALENLISGNQKIALSFTMQHIKKPTGHDDDPEKGGIWRIDPINIFTPNPKDPGGGSPSGLKNEVSSSSTFPVPHNKFRPPEHIDTYLADIVGTPFGSSGDATNFRGFVFESEGKHRQVPEPNSLYLMFFSIFILMIRMKNPAQCNTV